MRTHQERNLLATGDYSGCINVLSLSSGEKRFSLQHTSARCSTCPSRSAAMLAVTASVQHVRVCGAVAGQVALCACLQCSVEHAATVCSSLLPHACAKNFAAAMS